MHLTPHLHFVLLFWNHVFTCESVSWRCFASLSLSVDAKYFWPKNLASNSATWSLLKVVLGFFLLGGVLFEYGWPILRYSPTQCKKCSYGMLRCVLPELLHCLSMIACHTVIMLYKIPNINLRTFFYTGQTHQLLPISLLLFVDCINNRLLKLYSKKRNDITIYLHLKMNSSQHANRKKIIQIWLDSP